MGQFGAGTRGKWDLRTAVSRVSRLSNRRIAESANCRERTTSNGQFVDSLTGPSELTYRPIDHSTFPTSVEQFLTGDDVFDGQGAEEVVANPVGEVVVLVQRARLQDEAVAIPRLIRADDSADQILF